MGSISEDIQNVMGNFHKVEMGSGIRKAVIIDLQETKSKENEKPIIFICPRCGGGFSEEEAREAHEQEEHGAGAVLNIVDSDEEVTDIEEVTESDDEEEATDEAAAGKRKSDRGSNSSGTTGSFHTAATSN
jgi:transcription initiation factor IIE alpha subunit